ncbi:MAG: Aldose 1-epimerase [Acidimicrobiales bacterium]|nr:Aldose 1-epimerase [Acidimicrobiales bacterium]
MTARVRRRLGEAALTISADDLEATFLPDVGFLGISLRRGGDELLALPGGVKAYRSGHVTGLPLLAPWANRLGQRHYEIAGVGVDLQGLALHDDGGGLPIHGTMTAQPGWELERLDGASLRARFDFGGRPDLLASFPFPHQLILDVDVNGGSLTVATTVRPTAETRVPVSFGWHPYFRLPASRARTRLRLPAARHVLLDDRGLPTGASEPQPETCEPIGERSFDDLHALDADRRLVLEGDGRTVSVEFDEGYPFAQVYSPAGARFACLEPMTAPTNALVTGDCPLVEPGNAFTARFTVGT